MSTTALLLEAQLLWCVLMLLLYTSKDSHCLLCYHWLWSSQQVTGTGCNTGEIISVKPPDLFHIFCKRAFSTALQPLWRVELLASGWRFRGWKATSKRVNHSFISQATKLLTTDDSDDVSHNTTGADVFWWKLNLFMVSNCHLLYSSCTYFILSYASWLVSLC